MIQYYVGEGCCHHHVRMQAQLWSLEHISAFENLLVCSDRLSDSECSTLELVYEGCDHKQWVQCAAEWWNWVSVAVNLSNCHRFAR